MGPTLVALNTTFFSDLETSAYDNILPPGTSNAFTYSGTTSGTGSTILSTTANLTSSPEPSSLLLLGAGLLSAAVFFRNRRARSC